MMPKTGKLSGVFGQLLIFPHCVMLPEQAHAAWQSLCLLRGTAPYMAPEMLRNEGYDFLADVWSIGATFFEL